MKHPLTLVSHFSLLLCQCIELMLDGLQALIQRLQLSSAHLQQQHVVGRGRGRGGGGCCGCCCGLEADGSDDSRLLVTARVAFDTDVQPPAEVGDEERRAEGLLRQAKE